MPSEPPPEDREELSPELVLVSGADAARRAREQLPEPPGIAVPVAAAPPAPAPAPAEPVVDIPAAAPAAAAAPTPIDRPPPPAYPRIVVDDLPPEPRRRRRRGRVALGGGLLAAAIAAGGYLTETQWHTSPSTPAAAVPAAPAAPQNRPVSVPTTAARARQTTQTRPAHAPATGTQRATTATSPAAEQKPQTATTKPRSSPPRPPAGFVPARTFAWAPRDGASAYDVTFFLEGRVVLRLRPKKPSLVLPRSFRFQAGRYRWTVQPLPAAANRKPIVDSAFVLTPAAAAAANGS